MSNNSSVNRKSPAGASGSSAEGASRTKSPAPWWFNFDGPGADAGVIPSGVKFFPAQNGSKKSSHDSWEAQPRDRQGPARGFAIKNEAYQYAGARMVRCPINGRWVPEGDTGALCRYLASTHPGEWERLKKASGGRVKTLFVYIECYSISRRYKHNSVPGHSFATIDDMNWALRESSKPNASFRNPNFLERKDGTTFFKDKKSSPKTTQPSMPPKATVSSKPPDAPVKKSSNPYDVLADAHVKNLKKVLEAAEIVDEPLLKLAEVDDEDFTSVKSKSTLRKEKQVAPALQKKVRKSKPVVELPTEKEPTEKEPTEKEPTEKEPTVKEPAVKEPTVKEPVAKKPMPKKPTPKEPVNVPSWKTKCLVEKTQRDAVVKQLEDQRLEAEAEVQRLKEEADAEEERSKVEAEETKIQDLFDQFKGMVMLPSKKADEPKKGSAKRSKGSR
jgi:hypothetical protein